MLQTLWLPSHSSLTLPCFVLGLGVRQVMVRFENQLFALMIFLRNELGLKDRMFLIDNHRLAFNKIPLRYLLLRIACCFSSKLGWFLGTQRWVLKYLDRLHHSSLPNMQRQSLSQLVVVSEYNQTLKMFRIPSCFWCQSSANLKNLKRVIDWSPGVLMLVGEEHLIHIKLWRSSHLKCTVRR